MLQTRCKSGKNGSNMLQFPRPAKHPKHLFYFVLGRGFLDSKQEEIKAILTWIYLLLSIRVLIWALPTDWRRKTPRIELFVWQAIILYYLITDLAPAIFLGLALCSWVPLGDRFKLSLTFCKTWCMSIYIYIDISPSEFPLGNGFTLARILDPFSTFLKYHFSGYAYVVVWVGGSK